MKVVEVFVRMAKCNSRHLFPTVHCSFVTELRKKERANALICTAVESEN